jgi:hypothetical protein
MKNLSTLAALAALAAAGAALAQPAPNGGGGGGGQGGPLAAFRAACQADMQKFCADTQPGPGRGQCMRAHQADLSPDCKAAMAQLQAARPPGGGPPPSSAPPGGGQ